MRKAKPEQENDVEMAFSTFDIMIGRYVLDKKVKTPSPHDSLLKIGGAFIADFCKKVVGADRSSLNQILTGLEKEPARKAPAAAGKSKSDASKPELPLYSIDKAGKATGLALLRSHALDVGSTITFPGEEKIWEIAGASGSYADLAQPGKAWNLRMSIEDLVQTAQTASKKDLKVKHESWPASRAWQSPDCVNAFVKARVLCALEVLCRVVGDKISDQVDVFVKPTKNVVSKLDIPKGELVIILEGNKVVIIKKGEAIPHGHFEVVCMDSPPGFEDQACLVPSSGDGVSPWCFVDQRALANQVNMVPMFF